MQLYLYQVLDPTTGLLVFRYFIANHISSARDMNADFGLSNDGNWITIGHIPGDDDYLEEGFIGTAVATGELPRIIQ